MPRFTGRRGRCRRNSEKFRTLLFPVFLAALLVGAMVPIAQRTTTIAKTFTAIERMMIAALLVALSLLFCYSGKLGLSWRSELQELPSVSFYF